MPDRTIRRRTLFRTAGAAAGAIALSPLLAACQSASPTSASPAPATVRGPKLPTYRPHGPEWRLPAPDLAGDAQGNVQPGYFSYPKGRLITTVTKPPGDG